MYVCMHVCVRVCKYVCMVCMYVYLYVYINCIQKVALTSDVLGQYDMLNV